MLISSSFGLQIIKVDTVRERRFERAGLGLGRGASALHVIAGVVQNHKHCFDRCRAVMPAAHRARSDKWGARAWRFFAKQALRGSRLIIHH